MVWDKPDSRKDLLALNQLHDVDAGVIVAHAPPKGSGSLASAVLRALGKDLTGLNGRRANDVDLALSWLRGEQIRELVIYGAHRLQEDLWKYLELGPRLWLITPSRSATDRFSSMFRSTRKTGARQAINAIEKAVGQTTSENPDSRSADQHEEKPRFPCIPFNDFTTFLAACHDYIKDPAEAALVQNAFSRGRNLVWDTRSGAENDQGFGQLKSKLADALRNTADQREAICLFRGIQTGLFWTGHAVEADLRDILAAVSIDRISSTDTLMRQGIVSQASFLPASAAVLAHTTTLTDAQIAHLKKRNLKSDCSSITHDGTAWKVPPELRSPLRILMNSWTSTTERPGDRLYRHYRDLQQPIEVKRAVWKFQEATGVQVRAAQTEHPMAIRSRHSLLHKQLNIVDFAS